MSASASSMRTSVRAPALNFFKRPSPKRLRTLASLSRVSWHTSLTVRNLTSSLALAASFLCAAVGVCVLLVAASWVRMLASSKFSIDTRGPYHVLYAYVKARCAYKHSTIGAQHLRRAAGGSQSEVPARTWAPGCAARREQKRAGRAGLAHAVSRKRRGTGLAQSAQASDQPEPG